MNNYTLTVFSENQAGLLGLITTVFTCRNINIESLSTGRSSVEGIHRYTIEVCTDSERVDNLAKQIEKKIDVLKAYIQTTEEYQRHGITKEMEKIILRNCLNFLH